MDWLFDDSRFLYLDATAWTALATIVAAALGVYGAFWRPFVSWIRRPKLRIETERLAEYSELIGDIFFLRVPIANGKRKRAAKEIEVFLESIREEHVDYPLKL